MYAFFFFNDTATTEIYTLSLHDALPIYRRATARVEGRAPRRRRRQLREHHRGGEGRDRHLLHVVQRRRRDPVDPGGPGGPLLDRKSTRLNSSHANISYAVFCLKKKNQTI